MIVRACIEALLIALVLVGVVSQVAVPAWRGRRLFPAFRRAASARAEVRAAAEDVEAARVERRAEALKARAAAVRDVEARVDGQAADSAREDGQG